MTTPDQLIAFITSAQAQIKATQAHIDACKLQLQALYETGDIPDKISTPSGSASLTQRISWSYSSAVKQLQELEQLEGVATKKTSSSWTIRPANHEQLDF